jgi:hypothetical protein
LTRGSGNDRKSRHGDLVELRPLHRGCVVKRRISSNQKSESQSSEDTAIPCDLRDPEGDARESLLCFFSEYVPSFFKLAAKELRKETSIQTTTELIQRLLIRGENTMTAISVFTGSRASAVEHFFRHTALTAWP